MDENGDGSDELDDDDDELDEWLECISDVIISNEWVRRIDHRLILMMVWC